jgi:hypothetical protein
MNISKLNMLKNVNNKLLTNKLKEQVLDVAELNEDAHEFMHSVIKGVHRAAVIYGQSGMGKTHVVTNSLRAYGLVEGEDFVVLRSHTTPLMLYVWLYMMREKGKFVVLDDCDGIISNENGLNLLKGATDNTFRQVGWATSQDIYNPLNKQVIPSSFEFEGTVIITTNIRLAEGKSRIANHMDAIRSRAASYSLNLQSTDEQFAQIVYMVLEKDYLSNEIDTAITESEKLDLLNFLMKNIKAARRLDLRLPQIIAREMKSKKTNWERRALRLLEAA